MEQILQGPCFAAAAPSPGALADDKLASMRVIVDGHGPLVAWVSTALRSVGVGIVEAGAYAAETLGWNVPRPRRRDHRATVSADLDLPGAAAVVAVTAGPMDPQVARPWLVQGLLHLPVEVHTELIQVGPLVVPGLSSCLACHTTPVPSELSAPHEAWSAGHAPVDPAVGVLAAALAALTVRTALLGDRSLAGVSCDVAGPRPDVAHRYWPPDPRCSCRTGSWLSA